MAKTIKNIRLENLLIEQISALAEVEYDGNFTAAVESLIDQSLAVRSLDDKVRWEMYSSAKRSVNDWHLTEKEYYKFITTVTDGLHI